MRNRRAPSMKTLLTLIPMVVALGCGAAARVDETESPAPNADPCDGVSDPAYEVWNDKVKDGLDFSVRIYEGHILASDAETAVSWMTAFTDSWTKTILRLCRDHRDGAVDEADYVRMTGCLERALEDQRTVAGLLRTASADDIDRAVSLVDEIRACAPDAEIIEPAATPEETVYKENPFAE